MYTMDVKWQISLFSALIFILVVHPMTYKLTQKMLGDLLGRISDANGCPTTIGLALHTIVYILLVRGSMEWSLFT
jgi:hypothetical protein